MFQLVGFGGSGLFAMAAVSVARSALATKNGDAGGADLVYGHAASSLVSSRWYGYRITTQSNQN
jgi:hypothetical protein